MTRSILQGRVTGESWDVLVDLGDRPEDISAPRQVTLMVISGESARGAWWFAQVDPTVAVVQLRSPTWRGLDMTPWRG